MSGEPYEPPPGWTAPGADAYFNPKKVVRSRAMEVTYECVTCGERIPDPRTFFHDCPALKREDNEPPRVV